MTKPRLQRKTAGFAPGGNGTPFTDEQLAEIARHEAVHAGDRSGELAAFVYTLRGQRYDWAYLLAIAEKREAFNARHSDYGTAFSEWPFTSADVRKVIAWRRANPAA